MLKIAYQGVPGSFSYQATKLLFPVNAEYTGTKEFRKIFELLERGEVTHGVIPIENTLAGSVHENYDHLAVRNVTITAEHVSRIEHHLMACKSELPAPHRLQELKKVYSHQKALEQCNRFFEQYEEIERAIASDTAGAAEFVSKSKDHSLAAIASREAAELYNLQILASNIEDNEHNYTRFVVLKAGTSTQAEGGKFSLLVTLAHESGALVKLLSALAAINANLTKLESRPVLGKPFEYNFYLDLEFGKEIAQGILQKTVAPLVHSLKILGVYNSHA